MNLSKKSIMKTSELLRILKNHACTMVEHGGRHDKYYSPITGRVFVVWRHKREIPTGTVQKILKQAGIQQP